VDATFALAWKSQALYRLGRFDEAKATELQWLRRQTDAR
jgi:hypothetical protein